MFYHQQQTQYHAIMIITQIWGRGDFYFSYKYQTVSNYNNLQFVSK